jgi:DinB superfamily
VSDPQAYRENLFTLLGDGNPAEVLAQTASTLADIVSTHSATVLRTRPFEGKWTPNEIIGHLVDGEWVYGYRLRLILCEDRPPILGTNQDSCRANSTISASRRSSLKRFARCVPSIWRCGNDCHPRT